MELSGILEILKFLWQGLKLLYQKVIINFVKLDRIKLKNRPLYKKIRQYTSNLLWQLKTPSLDIIGNVDITSKISEVMHLWGAEQKGIFITGEGGTGKTSLVIELAKSFALDITPTPVIYIDANDLADNRTPDEFISEKLGLEGSFTQEFKMLAEDGPCYFIVDQLDDIVNRKPSVFDSIIELLKDFSSTENIISIGVIRKIDADEEKKLVTFYFTSTSCKDYHLMRH
ncbi:MAG: ATP-binding protein [Anaerolineae bacterium]|nr:ATP-binding protein [Anaerolineae bacterium]